MNPHLTKNKGYGKSRSLVIVTMAYFLALVAALASYPWVDEFGPIWSALAMDVAATVVIWAVGANLMNASVYDPYWSVIPPFLAIYWWGMAGYEMELRQVLLMTVLVYWAVRLTSNWARDWPGLDHEDWRYQEMRAQNPKMYQFSNLFGICLFPTVLVFLGMLPAFPVLTGDNPANLPMDIVAFIVGMGAVTIQLFADGQMRNFRFKKKENQTNQSFYADGLWAWSRHPNYFGEVAMWFSLWLFAMSAG
ncbi:MAG: DUF1295 domain-containing protein, partial [Pseudomonadota bacterium]